jgi:hypothetical protein
MKKLHLMCVLLIACLAINTARATVSVLVNQQQYVFATEPRLVEVLAPWANKQSWYWPAAALYDADNHSLQQTRQQVLEQLTTLAQIQLPKDMQRKLAIKQLAANLSSWTLARRLPIAIDYDLARIKAAANPQFTPGKYILRLAPRSKLVHVLGAVKYSQQIAHLAHADVSEYMANLGLIDLANKDHVIIIQADGRVITAPVAYWNKTHQEVMPGSQIIVPFKESLFSPEMSKVNQQIVTLAINRVF